MVVADGGGGFWAGLVVVADGFEDSGLSWVKDGLVVVDSGGGYE